MLLNIESFLQPFAITGRIFVAYSGGVDSHVLLHLCAASAALKNRLTAVYVHHGLQAAAEEWAVHCQQTAAELGLDFLLLRVNAFAQRGESPEEAARNARYQALKAIMNKGDALLLAQHQEDQLETVLLQLFRGSGLKGLSGMPESIAFGPGVMLRPLLHVAKQAIDEYARAHGLHWVEDPTNQSSDYDRNFLRNEITPLLKQRWPALAKTVARAAGHCGEAQGLIASMAHELFLLVFNEADNTINIKQLQLLDGAEQQLVIRQWFGHLGLKMPAQYFVKRLFSDVLAAREDSDPVLSGQGRSLRRYRDKLYCLPQLETEALADLRWPRGQASLPIGRRQILSCIPSPVGISREQWDAADVEVRFRSGGEKIALPGRQGRHALKKLYQEAGIPPWERAIMPLIYLDGKLAAVGDLWISAEFYREQNGDCIRLSRQV